jgi:hypothetical protein
MGCLHAARRDALASKLRGARRLRAEQSVAAGKSPRGTSSWRVQDSTEDAEQQQPGSGQKDRDAAAVCEQDQSKRGPGQIRSGSESPLARRRSVSQSPTPRRASEAAGEAQSRVPPRPSQSDGRDSLLSRVALPGLTEVQKNPWPVRSTPLPMRGLASPYHAANSTARAPSPRHGVRRPSTGGRRKSTMYEGLFVGGDRPSAGALSPPQSLLLASQNEGSFRAHPPSHSPAKPPPRTRPVTAPVLQRHRAFPAERHQESSEVAHEEGSCSIAATGDSTVLPLSEAERHVKLSWAHGLVSP